MVDFNSTAHMKQSPKPATVQDTDNNDNPVLHSKRSANRVTKKHTRMASPQGPILGQSRCIGPIEEALKAHSLNRDNIFTIFSQSQDRSRQRNEIQGYQYRKIFFVGEKRP
jgi:hypothetical protein